MKNEEIREGVLNGTLSKEEHLRIVREENRAQMELISLKQYVMCRIRTGHPHREQDARIKELEATTKRS